MRAAGLKVLKNKLSEYVRLADGGETVLVIDRAEIVPPQAGRSQMLADTLAEAVRNGWITPPAIPERTVPPRMAVTTSRELMQELRRDREDRRFSG